MTLRDKNGLFLPDPKMLSYDDIIFILFVKTKHSFSSWMLRRSRYLFLGYIYIFGQGFEVFYILSRNLGFS